MLSGTMMTRAFIPYPVYDAQRDNDDQGRYPERQHHNLEPLQWRLHGGGRQQSSSQVKKYS
jgi:hypothetical protein